MGAREALTFLTPEEVRRITGKKYAPAQRRVLMERGIRFTPDGDGKPVVMRAHVERRLLGYVETTEAGPAPDFSVFPAV